MAVKNIEIKQFNKAKIDLADLQTLLRRQKDTDQVQVKQLRQLCAIVSALIDVLDGEVVKDKPVSKKAEAPRGVNLALGGR